MKFFIFEFTLKNWLVMKKLPYLVLILVPFFSMVPYTLSFGQEKSDYEIRREKDMIAHDNAEEWKLYSDEMKMAAAEDDRFFSFLIGKMRGLNGGSKSDLEMFFELFDNQKYTEATGYLEKIAREANNSTVQYYLGVVYNKTKRYNYAIVSFENALKLGFEKEKCYIGRAYAYTMSGVYGSALVDYNEALRFNNLSPDIYRARGILNYHLTKYKDAIKDLEKAIFLEPTRKNESEGYLFLSRSKFRSDSLIQAYYLKNLPNTIEAVKDALQKSPKSIQMHIKFALLNLRLNNYSQASSSLHESRLLEEDLFDSSFKKREIERSFYYGIIYNRTSEPASARQCLAKLRSGEKYLCLQADIYITRREYEKAIANCTELINNYQALPPYYNQRGYAYYMLGQFKLAIDDYDLAKKSKLESYFPNYEYRAEANLALKKQKLKTK